MNKPTLYMMMGYPGAGKTTVSEIIAKLTSAEHLSSDKIRMELFTKPTFNQQEHGQLYRIIDKKTENLLAHGKSVIYDANLNRYEHRQEKYDICQRTNAKPVLIWLQTPKDIAKERAAHTSRQHLWPENETPEAMFDRIAGIIEEPKPNEPVVKMVGQDIDEKAVKNALQL